MVSISNQVYTHIYSRPRGGRGDQVDELMYAYPRSFPKDLLIDAESEKIIPYIDVPLQHISTLFWQ